MADETDNNQTQESQSYEALVEAGRIEHFVLADQPTSVAELSSFLYAPYEVEGGSLRLGGCTMDDFAIVELTPTNPSRDLVDLNGEPIHSRMIRTLDLERIEQITSLDAVMQLPAAKTDVQLQIEQLVAEKRLNSNQGLRIIWCKWAAGKLIAEIGDRSAEIAFEGWARSLAEGPDRAPAFVCPFSGKSSYQIVSDDDGFLTVDDAIELCPVSAKFVIAERMAACAVSGERILPEWLWKCPVSGDLLNETKQKKCRACLQPSSPNALRWWRCKACRELSRKNCDQAFVSELLVSEELGDQVQVLKAAIAGERTVVKLMIGGKKYLMISEPKQQTKFVTTKWGFGRKELDRAQFKNTNSTQ